MRPLALFVASAFDRGPHRGGRAAASNSARGVRVLNKGGVWGGRARAGTSVCVCVCATVTATSEDREDRGVPNPLGIGNVVEGTAFCEWYCLVMHLSGPFDNPWLWQKESSQGSVRRPGQGFLWHPFLTAAGTGALEPLATASNSAGRSTPGQAGCTD